MDGFRKIWGGCHGQAMRIKLISLTPPGVIHIPSNNHVITSVGGETIYDGEPAIIKVIPDVSNCQ